ncbi:MAG: metallophosphoesterase [Planctomycetaceae bacterium]|nr:metallophosphoesterase [Planctomycetaceae bacterium]
MKPSLLLFLVSSCLIPICIDAYAQDEAKNLEHMRHTHHSNPPHPTEKAGEKRFYTTRSSEVALPLPTEEDSFVFAVFGDRTGGPVEGINVLADAVRDVNLIEPDLVMTVGDLINGYNQTDKWLEQMREFKFVMKELRCPWFPVAGNHDVYWRPLIDPQMPRAQHDQHYEMHFGPLWYSFQHKNCNFIVLYSDEGDPETGEKNFSNPNAQKVSEEQYTFLKEALKRGEKSAHQFLFLHHPRWLEGGYGTDWTTRVHPLLKESGNVTAVFAGHIHYMRSDPKDGIEYVALATVGGNQPGTFPKAGYLHQYHLVTVRPKQVAMVSFPVGEAMNVREITKHLQDQLALLASQNCKPSARLAIKEGKPQDMHLEVEVHNPADRPVDFTLTPHSPDQRWNFQPTHAHSRLEPGASETIPLTINYRGSEIDSSFETVQFLLDQDYLAPTTRYPAPTSVTEMPLEIELADSSSLPNRALSLDGVDDVLAIPSSSVNLPQGPFTLEAWFQARSHSARVGLLAKTQQSEYSIFLYQGVPSGDIHLGDNYQRVGGPMIPVGKWTHIAMVYEGNAIKLYVNGLQVDKKDVDPNLKRTLNNLPFMIGADPDGSGKPTSFFNGLIDEVRLTSSAVYQADFQPARRLQVLPETIFLYNFDQSISSLQVDSGPNQAHGRASGGATLVEVAD